MEVLVKLRELGYQAKVEGQNIILTYTGEGEPNGEVISPLIKELRNRKQEAIAYLKLEEKTQKALRQLKKRGFVKIWSEKIQKTVYFIPEPKDRAKLPIDAVAFTFSELRELTARRATPEELRMLYNKKDLNVKPDGR